MILEPQAATFSIADDVTPINTTGLVAPEDPTIVGSISSRLKVMSGVYFTNIYGSTLLNNFTAPNAYTTTNVATTVNACLGGLYGTVKNTSPTASPGVMDNKYFRQLEFSNGDVVGYRYEYELLDVNTAYHDSPYYLYNDGYNFRVMPIRNSSEITKAVTIRVGGSSSSYETGTGMCLFALVPNSGLYSNVKTCKSVMYHSVNPGRSYSTVYTFNSITIPPKSTILLFWVTSGCGNLNPNATGTGANAVIHTNYFDYLWRTFEDPYITCDIRMLSALTKARFSIPTYDPVNGWNSEGLPRLAPLWKETARLFGDR
jgi:hypothetical protein